MPLPPWRRLESLIARYSAERSADVLGAAPAAAAGTAQPAAGAAQLAAPPEVPGLVLSSRTAAWSTADACAAAKKAAAEAQAAQQRRVAAKLAQWGLQQEGAGAAAAVAVAVVAGPSPSTVAPAGAGWASERSGDSQPALLLAAEAQRAQQQWPVRQVGFAASSGGRGYAAAHVTARGCGCPLSHKERSGCTAGQLRSSGGALARPGTAGPWHGGRRAGLHTRSRSLTAISAE